MRDFMKHLLRNLYCRSKYSGGQIDRNVPGPVLIWRCRLANIGNPTEDIRRAYGRIISTMGFPLQVRHLYIETGAGENWYSVLWWHTVETLYSTIYYSKCFIKLNFDTSTQYVAFWTHKRHPIPRPFGRAMECLLWVLQQKLTVL